MTTTKTRTYSVGELKQAAYRAGFRGHNLVIAVAVSLAENPNRDPRAVNINRDGSIDRGAWQINSVHQFDGNPYDLQTNANQAYRVWRSQGWRAWTQYRNKGYASKLAAAQSANTVGRPATGTAYPLGGGLLPNTDPPDDLHSGPGVIPKDSLGYDVSGGDTTDVLGVPIAGANVGSWTSSLGTFLGHLIDPGLWKRIGIVALGVLILAIGLVVLLGSNKTVRQGAELAATKGLASEH